MPTVIAIESKNVTLFGARTPFEHLYLVKKVTNDAGGVIDERVIRGDVGSDLSLVAQANSPLGSSPDARGSATLAQRHHTPLDLGGRDPDEVWNLMVQHTRTIGRADLRYGVEAFNVDHGGDVNSNTVVASALHTVGISLARNLPSGIEPREIPLYNRLDAVLVDDALIGRTQDDIIRGGVGDDSVRGMGGNDRLFGEIGADSLSGGSGNDFLDGGVGIDWMHGGAGNDTYRIDHARDRVIETSISATGGLDLVISTVSVSLLKSDLVGVERLSLRGTGDLNGIGNNLDNSVVGNSRDNVLSGRLGNDLLIGGAGDDKLYGSTGNDTLRGGDGDDNLIGGVSSDILAGGAGSDAFVYKTVAESAAGIDNRDQIIGFKAADVIDLDSIDANTLVSGNQGFAFIGSAAFTGAGQLRFELDGAGNTIVQADVNGDLIADFEIALVVYTNGLTAGDFVL